MGEKGRDIIRGIRKEDIDFENSVVSSLSFLTGILLQLGMGTMTNRKKENGVGSIKPAINVTGRTLNGRTANQMDIKRKTVE